MSSSSSTHRSRTRLLAPLLVLLTALALSACGGDEETGDAAQAAATSAPVKFKVGAGADNPNEINLLKYIAETLAPEHGIELETVELPDSVALNEAVNHDELDGHVAQHWPYLSSVKDERGWKVEPVAPLYVSNFAIYSTEFDSLDALPEGASFALPDDPSSQALSLKILADKGLITIDPSVQGLTATVQDVADNPKQIKFKPLVIQQIARAVRDVDIAIAPAWGFKEAGVPVDQQLDTVPADPSYAITLVIKEGNKSQPGYDKLIETFSDERISQFVDDHFEGASHGVAGRS